MRVALGVKQGFEELTVGLGPYSRNMHTQFRSYRFRTSIQVRRWQWIWDINSMSRVLRYDSLPSASYSYVSPEIT